MSNNKFERAWENVGKLTAPTTNEENRNDFYKKWSNVYDEDFIPEFFGGPRLLTTTLEKYYPKKENRLNVRIMDLCAGTGLVGAELLKMGFTSIDALDASEEMLTRLRAKKIYRKDYKDMLGNGRQTEIPSNTYDVVTLSGAFVQGHLPVDALEEIHRICKKGGLIFNCMRLDFIDTVEEYRGKLEPYMKKMEQEGKWKILEREIGPDFMKGKDGVTFVFRKM